MTLKSVSQPYRPPTHALTLHQIHGKVLTTPQVVEWAVREHKAGRNAVAYDLLARAGLSERVLNGGRVTRGQPH